MKIVYTRGAMRDLEDAHQFIEREWPGVLEQFERRLTEIECLVSEHPHSGRELTNRRGVYAVPLIRYPYKFFYRIAGEIIEVLHVYHTSRRPW